MQEWVFASWECIGSITGPTSAEESPTNCKKGSKIAAIILGEFIAQWDYQIFNSHVSLSVIRSSAKKILSIKKYTKDVHESREN